MVLELHLKKHTTTIRKRVIMSQLLFSSRIMNSTTEGNIKINYLNIGPNVHELWTKIDEDTKVSFQVTYSLT